MSKRVHVSYAYGVKITEFKNAGRLFTMKDAPLFARSGPPWLNYDLNGPHTPHLPVLGKRRGKRAWVTTITDDGKRMEYRDLPFFRETAQAIEATLMFGSPPDDFMFRRM